MAKNGSCNNNIRLDEAETFITPSNSTGRFRTAKQMACYDRFFASSLEDLTSARFYRALIAEMIGVMFLVFVACSSPYGESVGIDQTRISLSFGLSVATLVWILANVSGGHINPAVSAAMFVTRKISLAKFLLYVVFQCIGGVMGSLIQRSLTCDWQLGLHESSVCGLGLTTLGSGVSPFQGFSIEFLITFILVITVFATCDKSRKDLNGSGPLAIGLSVTMCHLGFIKLTGASMNTARTFGPAVVLWHFEEHWVYWCGPIFGGIAAGLIYEFIFAGDVGVDKLVGFIKDPDYGRDRESVKRPNAKKLYELDNEACSSDKF